MTSSTQAFLTRFLHCISLIDKLIIISKLAGSIALDLTPTDDCSEGSQPLTMLSRPGDNPQILMGSPDSVTRSRKPSSNVTQPLTVGRTTPSNTRAGGEEIDLSVIGEGILAQIGFQKETHSVGSGGSSDRDSVL